MTRQNKHPKSSLDGGRWQRAQKKYYGTVAPTQPTGDTQERWRCNELWGDHVELFMKSLK